MRTGRWACLVAASVFLAGCTSLQPAAKDLVIGTPPVVEATVAPVVEAAVAPVVEAVVAPAEPDLAKLRRQLQEYLSQQEGTYGVFVLDLTTGKSVGINSNKVFPAASTFKLPMALYILDQVEQGKASLTERIAYSWKHWEDGTGVLQEWIAEGDELTVRELVELAITQSDNIATQMLLERFPPQNVYAFMRKLGGRVTHFEEGVVGTTPREMAVYLRNAQAGTAVQSEELRQFLLESLEHTAFTDRVAAGVPDGVAVAHKIGTLPGVVNDVALVELPEKPFIISAFSLDVDVDVAPVVIEEVTRKVYAFMTSS